MMGEATTSETTDRSAALLLYESQCTASFGGAEKHEKSGRNERVRMMLTCGEVAQLISMLPHFPCFRCGLIQLLG